MDDATLKKLQSLLEKEEAVVVAYLFGSAARGAMGRLSDVDVAVLLSDAYALTLDYRLHLMGKLAGVVGREADVVILNEAPPLLRYEVIKCGRVLYCRDELARVAFEERTLDEYLDMGRIEREYFRCLLQDVG
ncbi:nucleotidyltransferase domain-containing protein [Candidatus Bathyarchaeota archaeon]|nr:MAG: nucleotidyltransferase domain-containing protein [Candidatus Bathyarchaeota archaeon]